MQVLCWFHLRKRIYEGLGVFDTVYHVWYIASKFHVAFISQCLIMAYENSIKISLTQYNPLADWVLECWGVVSCFLPLSVYNTRVEFSPHWTQHS